MEDLPLMRMQREKITTIFSLKIKLYRARVASKVTRTAPKIRAHK